MKIRSKRILALSLLAAMPLVTLPVQAQITDFDKPVFEFQSKLAKQGNAKAQYFLAQMYEQGRGTDANAELAKHWYDQARRNGYQVQQPTVSASN